METTAKRIAEIIKYLDVSIPEFAKECKIDRQSVYNYMHGKNISAKNLEKISKRYPEINEVWLYGGRGSMFVPGSHNLKTKDLSPESAAKIIEQLEENLQTVEVEVREMRLQLKEYLSLFKIKKKISLGQ